ncbi:DUF6095 family protein [Tenacibaculum jejuense]|uniref:Uncharacterized protein n=1 Tax=Tenacibaculum jejuense TaxID=584609 RepID=A0A238U8D4_9FLAO|nr:DUF6095 family protein [Tenacibaculum jejuense]SNR15362.1 Protein of unknown function [Tenacibaculum jejuense]
MTNKSYEKPIKKFLILLSLLVISPVILSLAFRAQRAFTEMPKIIIAYVLLILGILLILYTVYFGFKTFKSLLDTLFED